MRFQLDIECDNAAFTNEDGAFAWIFATVEVGRILEELAPKIARDGRCDGVLRDVNGNRVGHYGFSETPV